MSERARIGYILMLASAGTFGISLVRAVADNLRMDYLLVALMFGSVMAAGFLFLWSDPEVREVGLLKWKPPRKRFLATGVALTTGGGTGIGFTLLGWVDGTVSYETLMLLGLISSVFLITGILTLWLALRRSTAEQNNL